jgi:hypothetical protein
MLEKSGAIGFALASLMALAPVHAAGASFTVEARIPLPGVKGRLDHLAYDAAGRRVFIAELENGSVSVVDVAERRVAHRWTQLKEPRGLAWYPAKRLLYVASGGDGMVRAYQGSDYSLAQSRGVCDDADNIRIEVGTQQLYLGCGKGALALLDAVSLMPVGYIDLKAHPESFQFSALDPRIFVNVPGAAEIAVVDRSQGSQLASWPTPGMKANYPMAVDHDNDVLLSAFREPAKLAAYPLDAANAPRSVSTCKDADDLFVDARRKRIYVVCGDGTVAVHESGTLKQLARTTTSPGARTGLYSTEADRLFVAVPASRNDAALWILKPAD